MILFIAIILSIIAFLKPKIGVLSLIVVFYTSAFYESEAGGFTLNRLIGIFCILGVIKEIIAGKYFDFKIDNFDFLFFGYLIAIGISLLVNGFYVDTVGKLINPVMGYVLYKLIVINFTTIKDFKYLLFALWLIPMIYIPITINSALETEYYRRNLVDNANLVAEYISMSCFVCIAINYAVRTKIRSIFTIIYVALGFMCIYLTGSRTILISLPFIILLYLLIYDKNNSVSKPFIITIGSLSFFLISTYIASILNPESVLRISGFFNEISELGVFIDVVKSEKRYILWDAGAQIFLDNPIVGVGFGGFKDSRRALGVTGGMAHNSYIDILSETGIIGFLFAFSMIYLSYKRLKSLKKFTTSIFDHNYINLFLIFFIQYYVVWVSLHHKSISRSMFLTLGICNALYYIAKDTYIAKKIIKPNSFNT